MRRDAVLDWGQSAPLPVIIQGEQTVVLRHPGLLVVKPNADATEPYQTLDTRFAGFFKLDQICFPFVSTLVPHPEKQPEARLRVVARTTPSSTAEPRAAVRADLSDKHHSRLQEHPRLGRRRRRDDRVQRAFVRRQGGFEIMAPSGFARRARNRRRPSA